MAVSLMGEVPLQGGARGWGGVLCSRQLLLLRDTNFFFIGRIASLPTPRARHHLTPHTASTRRSPTLVPAAPKTHSIRNRSNVSASPASGSRDRSHLQRCALPPAAIPRVAHTHTHTHTDAASGCDPGCDPARRDAQMQARRGRPWRSAGT